MKYFLPRFILIVIVQFFLLNCLVFTGPLGNYYIEHDTSDGRELDLEYQQYDDPSPASWCSSPKGKWVRFHNKNGVIKHRFCNSITPVVNGYLHRYMDTENWFIAEEKCIVSIIEAQKELKLEGIIKEAIENKAPFRSTYSYHNLTKKGKEMVINSPLSRYWIVHENSFDVFDPYDNQGELLQAMKKLNIQPKEWITWNTL